MSICLLKMVTTWLVKFILYLFFFYFLFFFFSFFFFFLLVFNLLTYRIIPSARHPFTPTPRPPPLLPPLVRFPELGVFTFCSTHLLTVAPTTMDWDDKERLWSCSSESTNTSTAWRVGEAGEEEFIGVWRAWQVLTH